MVLAAGALAGLCALPHAGHRDADPADAIAKRAASIAKATQAEIDDLAPTPTKTRGR